MQLTLTDDILKRYVGGQFELTARGEDYVYCGEVEHAWIEDCCLHIRFKWSARKDNTRQWMLQPDDQLFYKISLEIVEAMEIGGGIIHYRVKYMVEEGTFYPPNLRRLDPSQIAGLQPV